MAEKNVRQMFAGGIAGCVAKTVIAPLDRAKILLQVQHPYYKMYGVTTIFPQVLKREGLWSLWKGNMVMMARIFPYASIQFFTFERYKLFFHMVFPRSHFNSLLAGASAGLTAASLTYPMDIIRCRMLYQITGEHRYDSVWHALRTVFKEEGGVRGFYSGLSATLIGMVPYAGISFYVFDTLKQTGLTYFPKYLARVDPHNDQVMILKSWANIIAGACAGGVSQTVSYPCDVARRKMQLSNILPDSHRYNSIFSTIVHVYKTDGIRRGLYRGLILNYIRVIPQQAIAFTTYELLRSLLSLNVPNVEVKSDHHAT